MENFFNTNTEQTITPLNNQYDNLKDNYEKIILTLDTSLNTTYDGIKSLNLIEWLLEKKQ